MITTVVFDLDDTLYDEIEYCRSGFTCVANLLADLPDAPSAERIFSAFWARFTAGNRTQTFNAAFDELDLAYNDDLIRHLINVYRSHTPQITLPAESRDVLDLLHRDYTLALLTDGFLPAQKLKVRALKIEKYFKCIIYTEQLGRDAWKPSTRGFEKLIHDLDEKPENMAYVADNEKKDFIAPNQLGLATIHIIRPAQIHTESSSHPDGRAQHVIHGLTELPDLLATL